MQLSVTVEGSKLSLHNYIDPTAKNIFFSPVVAAQHRINIQVHINSIYLTLWAHTLFRWLMVACHSTLRWRGGKTSQSVSIPLILTYNTHPSDALTS